MIPESARLNHSAMELQNHITSEADVLKAQHAITQNLVEMSGRVLADKMDANTAELRSLLLELTKKQSFMEAQLAQMIDRQAEHQSIMETQLAQLNDRQAEMQSIMEAQLAQLNDSLMQMCSLLDNILGTTTFASDFGSLYVSMPLHIIIMMILLTPIPFHNFRSIIQTEMGRWKKERWRQSMRKQKCARMQWNHCLQLQEPNPFKCHLATHCFLVWMPPIQEFCSWKRRR
jgi:hypothetical protein